MEVCGSCKVKIMGDGDFCPLCGTALEDMATAKANSDIAPAAEGGQPPPQNAYPDLSREVAKYNFIKRLMLFVSVLGCGVCVLVNLLVDPRFLWSLIVLAAAAYGWLAVPPMLRRGANFGKHIVFTVILTSALAVALDFILGYTGWSVTYALPAICAAGIVATALMSVFNRTRWSQYVLYQVIAGVFGFIPLLLYAVGLAQNRLLVIIAAALALGSILATAFFGDRTIKSEFKRRFHF